MGWNKPLPALDEDIQPFWEGLKRHEFLLFRCRTCGAWYWPVAFCRNHRVKPLLGDMEWARASGLGTVFAFNVHYRAFHPGFADDVPYVYALIRLDEGPMFGTMIVGCKHDQVRVGARVSVVFEDVAEKAFTLPYFKLEAREEP